MFVAGTTHFENASVNLQITHRVYTGDGQLLL